MNATVDKLTAGIPATLDDSTRLSLKRTQLSAERTLMSWVRTAFSMISFGFTMGKFLEYLANQPDSRLSTGEGRLLPLFLVLIGLASLFIGLWEYRHLMVKLWDVDGRKHRVSALGIVGALVALLGVVAFAGLFVPLDDFFPLDF
jgi:putative membrane protein